jgi:hypothetical protein
MPDRNPVIVFPVYWAASSSIATLAVWCGAPSIPNPSIPPRLKGPG